MCDKVEDCLDKTDEGNKCDEAISACQSNLCGQICETTPLGPVCSCEKGYYESSNITCIDIDECAQGTRTPSCSHHCVNYAGGYNCTCSSGYHLDSGRFCKADGPEPLILVASYTRIVGFYPLTNRKFDIQTGLSGVFALAYGPDEMLYWTDVHDKAVYRTYLRDHHDVYRKKVVIDTGLESPEGIAVDWSTGHLYITDGKKQHILVCVNDGRSCAVLIKKLDVPRAIAIDQVSQSLFWSDVGRKSAIEKSWLDGRNRTVLVSKVGHPNRLVVDSVHQQLYWTDSMLNRIESINFDGSERKIVITQTLEHPFGVAVFEDTIYWSDIQHKTVSNINKWTTQDINVDIDNVYNPTDITIIHPVLYNTVKSSTPCVYGICGGLCLSSHNKYGFSCTCSLHKILDLDGVECYRNPNVTELLVGHKREILQLPLSNIGNHKEMTHSVFIDQLKNPFSVAVDVQESSLIYSDVDRDVIAKITIDDSDVKEWILYDKNLNTVEDLVVDLTTGNIFLVDTGKSTVEVVTSNGKYHAVLVKENLQRPNSLDIDSSKGYMYFSDVGPSPYIGMCFMDGTSCTPLNIKVNRPDDITLDVETGRLYFTEGIDGRIVSVHVPDGAQRQIHWQHTGHPFALAVDSDWIYWSDIDKGNVYKINKTFDHYHTEYTLLQDINQLRGIAIWDAKKLKTGMNGCQTNNGNCSHFCFPNPFGIRCHCADGWILNNDLKTCKEQINKTDCSNGRNGCIKDKCPDGVLDCKVRNPAQECLYNGKDAYLCSSGECVPYDKVCDGVATCADSSDDGGLCNTACKNQSVCQQICVATPQGPVCTCNHGYQLTADYMSCIDFDECSYRNGDCSQICTNTDGGYNCTCISEYQQSTQDIHRCIVYDPRPYLIISSQDGIVRAQDNGQTVQLDIGQTTGHVTAVDVVMETGNIFFSAVDQSHSSVYKYESASKNVTMVTDEDGYITDIAYDWLGNNLYVSNDKHLTLSVCGLDLLPTPLCKVLIYVKIQSIAVHPDKGFLYWIDSKDKSIYQSWMDGQHIKPIVTSDLMLPNDISIDYPADRIYWVDARRSTIESSKLDGTDRYIVLNERQFHHFKTIDVFEDLLYVGDWLQKSVYKYDKFGGTLLKLHDVNIPTCVKVVHPLKHRRGKNPCRLFGCSHLCLLTPEGPYCECPDGFWFQNNSTQNCTDKKTTTTTVDTAEVNTTGSTAPKFKQLNEQSESQSSNDMSDCPLACLNGGKCRQVKGQGQSYCICTENYSGRLCENRIAGLSELSSGHRPDHWVAGLVVGLVMMIIIAAAVLYCWRVSRQERDFQKYLDCHSSDHTHNDDAQELVSELSFASGNLAFGNPAFQVQDNVDLPVMREKNSRWYMTSPSSSDSAALIGSKRSDSGHSSPGSSGDSQRSSSSSTDH